MANEARLAQVFLNLLVHAAQGIPEGAVDRNEIRIMTRAVGGDRAVIEIRDTGAGIPPDVLSKIFDPFFTTKEVGKGTGLGLSIALDVARSHGGDGGRPRCRPCGMCRRGGRDWLC